MARACTFVWLPVLLGLCLCAAIEFDTRLSLADECLDLDLGGSWFLANANGSIKLNGTVPGNVHTDLLEAGLIPDPYYGTNDVDLRWIAFDNWNYWRSFDVPAALLARRSQELFFEGLDTVALVTLNGRVLGQPDNMFRRWVFDVTGLLRATNNLIVVNFTNADSYARAKQAEYPYPCPAADNTAAHEDAFIRMFIRKEQCSFGWDWAPAFMPMGIWQPVGLRAFDEGIITYVSPITTALNAAPATSFAVDVTLTVDVATAFNAVIIAQLPALSSSETAKVTLQPGTQTASVRLTVNNPKLWWPNGFGSPSLYNLTVTLQGSGGQVLDQVQQTIGFRTVELVQRPYSNQNGSSMYLSVNGVPVFVKGANFVPVDSFENRVTYDSLHWIIQSAASVGMNTLRVWGGGIYQSDAFYQICDELGMLVWQEFMFACALYPRDVPFIQNVAGEVGHNVKRLAHHPSIALWSGNNENEWGLDDWYPESKANRDLYIVDYAELYLNTIYPVMRSIDSSRPFWPSSPSNGPLALDPYVLLWGDPNSPSMGDIHHYIFTVPCTDISQLPTPRFVSEFGYQGMVSFDSIAQVMPASELYWNSSLMVHRENSGGQTMLDNINYQIDQNFPLNFTPTANATRNFKIWIYMTQCAHALCITASTEHYRRLRGQEANTMGAMYWMLNGIWQAPDWSSIEYGGRWKMLHYMAGRFLASAAVSSFEDPYDHYEVWAVNDLPKADSYTLNLMVYSWKTGQIVRTIHGSASNVSLSSAPLYVGKVSEMISGVCASRAECFFILQMASANAGHVVSDNHYYLTNLAEAALLPAKLTVAKVTQNSNTSAVVSLTAEAVAPYAFLTTNVHGRFAENGFVVFPGQTKNIGFSSTKPFTVQQLQDSLETYCIQDAMGI